MNRTIFKAYDIRALAPQEIDVTVAERIARAIVTLHRPRTVVVGRDMRLTSDEIEAGVVRGFTAMGVDVVRIGLCSTPLFNFAIGESAGAYDLGVMVTASHNPAEYNGLKLTKGDNTPIGQGSGMEEIRDLCLSNTELPNAAQPGKVTQDDGTLKRYIDVLMRLAKLPDDLPANVRIAVDAGNGMNGYVLPALAERLPGVQIIPLYWDLDGSFPNHEANPLKVETLTELKKTVVERGCMFGAAFDGDGDRVGFVDETGYAIPGDILTALLAKELLRESPGGHIIFDVRSSRAVGEIVTEAGGTSEMSRVGHAFIKRRMKETNAIFAGELSMHFYFREFWNCESSDYTMLLILRMMLREQKTLSELWKPFMRYVHSGEMNFDVQDPHAKIDEIATAYGSTGANISRIDGVRIDFDDWWFNVRASNTEPLLRLNLEARTEREMMKHRDELKRLIKGL